MWPSYWPWSFHMFVVKMLLFENLILPAERRFLFEKQKQWNKGGQAIDLWWPSYWPYSIYIYAVKLLSGPSLGFSKVMIWAKFVFFFFFNIACTKHYKIGVSALFLKKKCAQKFAKLLSGPSWPFFCCNKLGPDTNINLAQIITLENWSFFVAFENVLKHLFLQCFLNINPKLAKKGAKNDNFSHFSKHRLLKKTVLLQLPFWPKIGVS